MTLLNFLMRTYLPFIKLIALLLLLFLSQNSFAQTYNMSSANVSTCSGTFYDSGGTSGTYQNSESYTMTFCSSTPGDRLQFVFTLFNTENSFEHLIIYDGPNTSSPQIGNYTGTTSPGTITSTGTCLTFVFTSDGSVTYDGWAATISCLAPPPGYNMANLGTISTCLGYFYDSGAASANYGNNENYTVTFCSSVSGQQIKFTFSAFNTEAGVDILTVYDGPSTASPLLGTYSGTALPPVLSSTTGCLTFVFTSNGSTTNTGWLATISCTTPAPPTMCGGANPFCTGTTYNFPAGVNVGSAEVGANYGCLYSEPNPAWYYMQVANSGNLEIEMHSTPQVDIDFACWGPFSNQTTPCVSLLTAGTGLSSHAAPGPSTMYPSLNMVDCSYSTSWEEWCYIPNAVSGQYYILMITNFSNTTCNIIFSQSSGTGTTNCGILAPPITNNGPLCVGQTLQLTVTNPTPGATYSWTGPNGFTSSLMNPSIPAVTTANAGVYSMTITIGSQVSPPVTTTVVVNLNPAVTATAAPSSICLGASSVLSASSTITSTTYSWMPGSLSGSPVTVSPLTTTTYTVTGTATGCTGTNTVTVTIKPNPVITPTANPSTICNGASSSLSASSSVPGTIYSWVPGNLPGSPVSVTPITTTTYTVTGTAAGCTGSNIVTINVNQNPSLTAIATPTSICFGATSSLNASSSLPGTMFSWTPGNLPGSIVSVTPAFTTTYTVTGTAAGCTGSNSVTVNINPNPVLIPTSTPSTICNGASSLLDVNSSIPGTTYSWLPGSLVGSSVSVSPIVTTIYTVTGNASGCTASGTVTVTVNPNPVVTPLATPSTICNGSASDISATSSVSGTTYAWLPGNFTGSVVSVNPVSTTTYTVTGIVSGCTGSNIITVVVNPNPIVTPSAIPVSICNGVSSTLDVTSSVPGTTYSWMPGGMINSSVIVNPIVSTTYTITGTAAGCTGSALVTVTLNPNPVITTSASPSTICSSSSSSLNANSSIAGTTYLWMPGNLSGSPVIVTPVSSTTYTVTGNAPAGCTGSSTVSVTVNTSIALSANSVPPSICLGQSSQLTGYGADIYSWTPGNLSGNSITVSPSTTTVYTVNGSSLAGCTGVTTITIIVNPNPVISATASPSSVCNGQATVLNAYGASNYQWIPGNLSGSSVSVIPNASTTYSVTGTDFNGCTGSATISVNYITTPQVSIIASPGEGCSPLLVNFSYNTSGQIQDSSWFWNFDDPGSLNNVSNEINPSHVYNNGGIYVVQLNSTTIDGCYVHVLDTVFVSAKPVADFYFSPDYAYTNCPLIYFKDLSICASIWNWNFDDPSSSLLNNSHLTNPVHSFSDSGTYHVQLIVENNGCFDTVSKHVIIYLDALLFVPNAFTPNDDGVNDIFIPQITGVEDGSYFFIVFDRWGKEVFETSDVKQGWDGKYKGNDVSVGVFSYLIEYKEIKGIKHKTKGIITLVR
jgi:gliding motility-associated-like protein